MSVTTDYSLVKAEIASFLGTPESDWDSRTASDVESAIRKGIDAVVHNAANHQWSWMRPIHRFSTVAGQRRYPMPLDFEQIIDCIAFDGDEYGYSGLTQLPASRLLQLASQYDDTSVPCHFALEVETHDGASEQTQILVLHPTPDKIYQLVAPYQVGPIRSLSEDRPWFPGGPQNRELFIASCLAMTESKFMDQAAFDKRERFEQDLASAIGRDHRNQPRNFGQLGGGMFGGRRINGRDAYRWKIGTSVRGEAIE